MTATRETGEFDWLNDAQGQERLGYEAFFTLCFEIAEMWAGSSSGGAEEAPLEEAYIEFLQDLDARLHKARVEQMRKERLRRSSEEERLSGWSEMDEENDRRQKLMRGI